MIPCCLGDVKIELVLPDNGGRDLGQEVITSLARVEEGVRTLLCIHIRSSNQSPDLPLSWCVLPLLPGHGCHVTEAVVVYHRDGGDGELHQVGLLLHGQLDHHHSPLPWLCEQGQHQDPLHEMQHT